VDALIVVARLGTVDRQTIDDLSRELEASPTPKLGFILTGVERKDGYGYAGYSSYSRRRQEPLDPAPVTPEPLARPSTWQHPTAPR
jgi:hypothetical protein